MKCLILNLLQMNKYLTATLAGATALLVAFFGYGFVEQQIFGSDIYTQPIFKNMMTTSSLIGLVVLKLVHAFLLAKLHEVIPRCGSGLWAKVWRFSGLAWALIYIPSLGITYLSMNIAPELILSWAVAGLVQTFVASFVIVPVLYRYPAPDLSCQLSKH